MGSSGPTFAARAVPPASAARGVQVIGAIDDDGRPAPPL